MVLPVTVQGEDELTTLASCLDSMRKTLNRQHQEKAEADARVKNLITEMSHDLRTLLTTLLLYTEIVRDGRYDGQAQLQEYLAKIDTKARQIKQMSDNLFEYALVTRDAPADMDPPGFPRSSRSRLRIWPNSCSSTVLPAPSGWAARMWC